MKGGGSMPIDFFEKELRKARRRFNKTFGMQKVCNLKLRQAVILAIGFLGKACDEIKKADKKDDVRDEIEKFMKNRNVLNNLFNRLEQQQKERRSYANPDIKPKACFSERSNVG